MATLLVGAPARAADPDPALAFVAGAAISLAGFVAGSTVLATGGDDSGRSNAGWLVIEGGLALAPLAAHGVTGEWGRGAAFTAAPAAMLAGTATLFGLEPGTVDHGTLPQQRVMWALFGAAIVSSMAGVVDAMFALDRRRAGVHVAPAVGVGQLGVQIRGVL
jgi:hypothetical protein